jgi:hypothetical protein
MPHAKTLKFLLCKTADWEGVRRWALAQRLWTKSVARRYRAVNVVTWNTMPASMMRPLVSVIFSVFVDAAVPPLVACRIRESRSQVIKI